MAISRRDMLKYSGAAAAAIAVTGCTAGASPESEAHKTAAMGGKAAPIPAAKGKRVVIVGAGPSGLTIAKYLKKRNKEVDVVLIDKRSVFMSGFISNLVVTGILPLEFITHDFLAGARSNGYHFLQATAHDIDRKHKVVHTNEGSLHYDVLVLAPGIDYDYSRWSNGDVAMEERLRTEYPAAFIAGSETLTLKSKLENFEEGNFIITVPGGNYRCLPGPYERACLVADYFKKNDIPGKVIVLDENPNITIKADGFHSAFKNLYGDVLEYLPSSTIVKIDLDSKMVETELGEEIEFADAAFYPRVRGNKLLEIAGVAKDSVFNRMEADIDPFTYQSKVDPDVFCTGDVRPMGFSKSGNTANTEGVIVAEYIDMHLAGKKLSRATWKSPLTVCYSAVTSNPLRAVSVHAEYAYSEEKHAFGFANAGTMENWSGKEGENAGKGLLEWGKGLYRDFFM